MLDDICVNCQQLQQSLKDFAAGYWEAAEEAEDGAPDKLSLRDRLLDFALYLQTSFEETK
jgi:hypothetical protein